MKIIIALSALLLGVSVPAQSQIVRADLPGLLDVIVESISPELRIQDPEAAAEGISLDAASLPALQKVVPGLTSLPQRGRGYIVESRSETSRGVLLRILTAEPGRIQGEYRIRVDPTLRGRDGSTVIYTVKKENGAWRVVDGIVLVG